MSRYTTLGTGGPARFLATPEDLDELAAVLELAAQRDLEVITVGLGSNILVADRGLDALVVRLSGELAAVECRDGVVHAGGGAALAVCLHRAREAGLGGIEFVCAIPGTVGGGVWMNAGAYGGEIAAVLRRALVVDRGGSSWRSPAELGLSYRRSALRHGEVVARAEFELVETDRAEIRATVSEMQGARKAAQPTNRRTFGSVFKNPEHELSAGRLIDACGLRGHIYGGACISPKHANFIENRGNAATADALELIAQARDAVRERFGVALETEVQMLGGIDVRAPADTT
ncbi:MAG: UDP-N-acetylmuramate dehydrogenase [Gaiellaceae bacterium]